MTHYNEPQSYIKKTTKLCFFILMNTKSYIDPEACNIYCKTWIKPHIFANLYKTQAITCPYNAISHKLGIKQFQQSYNINELAKYSLFVLISTQSFTIFCKHDQIQNSNFLFSNNIKLQKCYKVSTSRITLKLNKLNLLISINHKVYNRTIEPCFFIPTNTQLDIDSLAFISISNLYSYFTCSLDTYVLTKLCYLLQ